MSNPLTDVTVVIPVGPGDRPSPRLLEQLRVLPPEAELHIVHADGEAPPPEAMSSGGPRTRVLTAPTGRAVQQNAGAAAAGRSWLWFLHADSRLAPDTLPALAGFLDRGLPALGYFRLCFLDDGPALMRVNALGARLRSEWLHLPFGDQGLVLPRASFIALGGFDVRLQGGEDHALVWRARRAGLPLRAIDAPLYTSARRYAEHGWWATTAFHLRETVRQARRFSRAEPTQ
ncbi:MAG TPA: glycosyltransferase [Rhodanobacteraceae bacterium]|nr:glycosyltransferase [Rhodanobacteraceae bacterium]